MRERIPYAAGGCSVGRHGGYQHVGEGVTDGCGLSRSARSRYRDGGRRRTRTAAAICQEPESQANQNQCENAGEIAVHSVTPFLAHAVAIFQQLTDTRPTQTLQMEECASDLSAPLVLLLLQPHPL